MKDRIINIFSQYLVVIMIIIISVPMHANAQNDGNTVDNFISHVRSYVGSEDWIEIIDGQTVTYCLQFIMHMTGIKIGSSSAIQAYEKLKNVNAVHPIVSGQSIPPGSIIWYDDHINNAYYGHVAIYSGNNNQISVTNTTVREEALDYFTPPLLGYTTLNEYCNHKSGFYSGETVFDICSIQEEPEPQFDVSVHFLGRTMCYDQVMYDGSSGPWTVPYDWDPEYREGDFRLSIIMNNQSDTSLTLDQLKVSIVNHDNISIGELKRINSSDPIILDNVTIDSHSNYQFGEGKYSFSKDQIGEYSFVVLGKIDQQWYELGKSDSLSVIDFPLAVVYFFSPVDVTNGLWQLAVGNEYLEVSLTFKNITSETVHIKGCFILIENDQRSIRMDLPGFENNMIQDIYIEPGQSFSLQSQKRTAQSSNPFYNFSNDETGEYKVTAKIEMDSGEYDLVSNDLLVTGTKTPELPASPYVLPIGMETSETKVYLSWRKIIDSRNQLNVDYYEILYFIASDLSSQKIISPVYDNSDPSNIFATNTHLIEDLQNNTTYYFQVRGVNAAGTGKWSDIRDIKIRQQTPPLKAFSPYPDNGEVDISKTPILKWDANDPDNDALDYLVQYGYSPDKLITVRGFSAGQYKGINQFDFSQEYFKSLQPNATIYWQIDVKDSAGNVTEGDIWQFNTSSTGMDLKIINAELVSELVPGAKATFKVTTKNIGNKNSRANWLTADYYKNNQSSPFLLITGNIVISELEPGESATNTIELKFEDVLEEKNGITYDDILVSGESSILFKLIHNDAYDINHENNAFPLNIYYENKGPTIEYFELRAHGDYFDGSVYVFRGNTLSILLKAEDDTGIKSVNTEFRANETDSWQTIYTFDATDYYSSNLTHYWTLPDNISLTEQAQIKVRVFDNDNEVQTKISKPFAIKSKKLNIVHADIDKTSYTVGDTIQLDLSVEHDNYIREIDVELSCQGVSSVYLLNEYNPEGIVLKNTYDLTIPDDNKYASNNCQLEFYITDQYQNVERSVSDTFVVNPNTNVPPPFKKPVCLFEYPTGDRNASIISKAMVVDDNNIAHIIVSYQTYDHEVSFSHYEDYAMKQYYIKFDVEQNAIISTKQVPSSYDVRINSLSMAENKLIAVFGLEDNIQYENGTWYPNRAKKVFTTIKSIEGDNFPSIFLIEDYSSSEESLLKSVGLNIGTNIYVIVKENGMSNSFYQIEPSNKLLGHFTNEYIQGNMTVCNNKFIDSTGKIYDLDNNSPDKTCILNFNENGGYMHPFYKNNGSSSNLAGFVHFDEKSWCVLDANLHFIEGSSSFDSLAELYEFDDEYVLAGRKDEKFTIARVNSENLNLTSEYSIDITFKGSVQDQSHRIVDMNANKELCVLYRDGLHYIVCADLSGDIIPPVIQFYETTTNFIANETKSISWTFSDNNDETEKIEIYEIIDNVENLLHSFNNKFSIQYTFPDSDNVKLKLIIYDKDNNIGFDEIEFHQIIPFSFYSITTDNNEYSTDEKIAIQWDDNGNQSTQYQIYYRPIQGQEWILWDERIGTKTFISNLSTFSQGEYHIKLTSNSESIELSKAVRIVSNEIIFTNLHPDGDYYTKHGTVEISWSDNMPVSSAFYSIWVKKSDDNDFNEVGNTNLKSYVLQYPDFSDFEYKISAMYQHNIYSSEIKSINHKPIVSPSISIINIQDLPAAMIYFYLIEGMESYTIERRINGLGRNTGNSDFIALTEISVGYYEDYDVEIGTQYDYRIVAKYKGQLAYPGEIKTVTIKSPDFVNTIMINNPYGMMTDNNSLEITFSIQPENAYKKFVILLGTEPSSLTEYTTTTSQQVLLESLVANMQYYLQIQSIEQTNIITAETDVYSFFTAEEKLTDDSCNFSNHQIGIENVICLLHVASQTHNEETLQKIISFLQVIANINVK